MQEEIQIIPQKDKSMSEKLQFFNELLGVSQNNKNETNNGNNFVDMYPSPQSAPTENTNYLQNQSQNNENQKKGYDLSNLQFNRVKNNFK